MVTPGGGQSFSATGSAAISYAFGPTMAPAETSTIAAAAAVSLRAVGRMVSAPAVAGSPEKTASGGQ
jgi:hypothetical protein